MKIKKVNHMVNLDNMVLIEFTDSNNDIFRFDYSHDTQSAVVMSALSDSHYVTDKVEVDIDDIENQLDNLLAVTPVEEIDDLTEEYKSEMEGDDWE
jgi:hypothetical protein